MVKGAYASGNFEGAKNLLVARNRKGVPVN